MLTEIEHPRLSTVWTIWIEPFQSRSSRSSQRNRYGNYITLLFSLSIYNALTIKPCIRSEDTWEEVVQHRERGRALFAKIYDRHTDRVLTNMHSFYPDLCQTALYQIYGPVFSDTTVLGAKESSMVLVTGLKATDVASQLKGHAYGALHNGATKPELRCINVAVDLLCQHYKLPIPKAKL